MNQHSITLMGRATHPGQTLTSKAGKEYSKFGVAINEYRGKDLGEETTFYDVVGFNRQCKAAARKVLKGDVVLVAGRPEVRAYESKSGELKAKLSVNAAYVQVYAPSARTREAMTAESDPEEGLDLNS